MSKIFYRPENKKNNFLLGLAALFDGLVSVMSFGFFGSNLTFRVTAKITKRELQNMRKRRA